MPASRCRRQRPARRRRRRTVPPNRCRRCVAPVPAHRADRGRSACSRNRDTARTIPVPNGPDRLAMSRLTSRSPSTRLNGPTSKRVVTAGPASSSPAVAADDPALRSHARASASPTSTARQVRQTTPSACRSAGRSGCRRPWRFRTDARILEAGFGTGDAGEAAADAGTDAEPRPRVAIGMRLRALAAEVLHQAAEVGRFLGTGLEFVELVLRAAVVHQLLGIEAGRCSSSSPVSSSAPSARAISVSTIQSA